MRLVLGISPPFVLLKCNVRYFRNRFVSLLQSATVQHGHNRVFILGSSKGSMQDIGNSSSKLARQGRDRGREEIFTALRNDPFDRELQESLLRAGVCTDRLSTGRGHRRWCQLKGDMFRKKCHMERIISSLLMGSNPNDQVLRLRRILVGLSSAGSSGCSPKLHWS